MNLPFTRRYEFVGSEHHKGGGTIKLFDWSELIFSGSKSIGPSRNVRGRGILMRVVCFFSCSLFLLDKEHAELVAEVFEKNGTSEEYLTEIRVAHKYFL
jgi:hypothetical protein